MCNQCIQENLNLPDMQGKNHGQLGPLGNTLANGTGERVTLAQAIRELEFVALDLRKQISLGSKGITISGSGELLEQVPTDERPQFEQMLDQVTRTTEILRGAINDLRIVS